MTYEWGKALGCINPLLIYVNKKEFSAMTAGFAFTMLGFMAAIITILFTFTSSENFQRYKASGYLKVFFVGYFICIATLMLTAFFSVFGFSSVLNVWLHRALLICFFNSLWQISILTLVICNLARNSST